MKIISFIFTAVMSMGIACSSQSNEFTDLASLVANLNIQRNDYTLGQELTDRQKKTARKNAVAHTNPDTYKFKDGDLFIVADKTTDRILILYEKYEPASREKIRELVGTLFFDFGDPTVMAHDKIIYWAFDQKGKLSEKAYRKVKDNKERLNILATVKLSSSEKIMEKNGDSKEASIYYIISSEPLLKLIQSGGE